MARGRIFSMTAAGLVGAESYSGWPQLLVGAAPPSFHGGIGYGHLDYVTGDDIRLSYYAKDATGDHMQIVVEAFDIDGVLISTPITDSWTPSAGVWTHRVVTGTVPANTYLLRARADAYGATLVLDHFDVFVGDLADGSSVFTNLALDSLTGWTASGTWSVDTSDKLLGTGCAQCDASGEIYQQQNLSAAYDDEGDVVWLSCWERYAHAGDSMTVILEARDSGGAVAASATLGAAQGGRSPIITGTWYRRECFLTLPSGLTGGALRIRGVGVKDAGGMGPMLDGFQCLIVKGA